MNIKQCVAVVGLGIALAFGGGYHAGTVDLRVAEAGHEAEVRNLEAQLDLCQEAYSQVTR